MIIYLFFGCELPMTDINKLKEEELKELSKPSVEMDEVGLEDLIVLGESKKIPIHIIYPNDDGTKSKSKALIRQLTLKELDKVKLTSDSLFAINLSVLKIALFKTTGDSFTEDELMMLPLGVVDAVANQIMEISGVDWTNNQRLPDF